MTIDEANEYAKHMTYEKAVYNALQGIAIPYRKATLTKLHELLEVAKKIDIENKPCDDAISRQELIDALVNATGIAERCGTCNKEESKRYLSEFIRWIKGFPPVTPQPKTGHWIIKEGREQGYDIAGIKTWYVQILCSECGFIKTAIEGHTGQYHYCPNCGARMESGEWITKTLLKV